MTLYLRARGPDSYPVEMIQRDRPDFALITDNSTRFVEITTAAIPQEQKKWTHKARTSPADTIIPCRPLNGDEEVQEAVAKVKAAYQVALRKKLKIARGYDCSPLHLLIYDNIGWDLIGPVFEHERAAAAEHLMEEMEEEIAPVFTRVSIIDAGSLKLDRDFHGR